VVKFYLVKHPYFFGRLDSGGETSPKATFLATTLGLRRLLRFLEAISSPNHLSAFLKNFFFRLKKTHLNSTCYIGDKNLILREPNFDVKGAYSTAEKSATTAEFSAMEGRKE